MKKVLLATLTVLVALITGASSIQAVNYKPVVTVSPDSTVKAGVNNSVEIAMVNMGIPIKRAEITVRLSGDKDEKWGFSFENFDTRKYGLAYQSHYFSHFAGRSDIQDLTIVFEATQPQGYNQGSAYIPLVKVTYMTVPGTLAATVIPEKTKLTGSDGNLIPSIEVSGSRNYFATENPDGLEGDNQDYSYNLSFESDPIRKWWPTAPNSVQQIDAAVWKDSNEYNADNFSNLSAEWQVDASFLEITNTSSSYMTECPVLAAGNRPCIWFVAHVITKKPGQSAITLRVTDNQTGLQVWNSYPLEIYSLKEPTPTPMVSPSVSPTSYPQPTFIPEQQISNKEFRDVQQKVVYLQSQLDQQQEELGQTQSLLNRVINFLKRIFRF